VAGIKRDLNAAIKSAAKDISDLASHGGMYARGLSSEGFAGGYYQALCDVQLALNGVDPERWRVWREMEFARKVQEQKERNQ
jgi:hypothetical protein